MGLGADMHTLFLQWEVDLSCLHVHSSICSSRVHAECATCLVPFHSSPRLELGCPLPRESVLIRFRSTLLVVLLG